EVPTQEMRTQHEKKMQSLASLSFYYQFLTKDKLRAIREWVNELNKLPLFNSDSYAFTAIQKVLFSKLLDYSCIAFPNDNSLVADVNVNNAVSFLTSNVSNNLELLKQTVENSSMELNQKNLACFHIDTIQKEVSVICTNYQTKVTACKAREKGIEIGKAQAKKDNREKLLMAVKFGEQLASNTSHTTNHRSIERISKKTDFQTNTNLSFFSNRLRPEEVTSNNISRPPSMPSFL
ncbi:MAG: hypothetical protein REH83_00275, partial [Rickettsiella sp.]|nr:hypothetical protein [Rickettsiella sp.]